MLGCLVLKRQNTNLIANYIFTVMSKKKSAFSGIIYSTNPAFNIQGNKENEISKTPITKKQDLRVWLERKGGGKVVTVVKGYMGNPQTLEEIGKMLKAKCGTGGTVKDYEILIQGDNRDKVKLLAEAGYNAKNAGG